MIQYLVHVSEFYIAMMMAVYTTKALDDLETYRQTKKREKELEDRRYKENYKR